jgi:hypothetical protein
LKLSELISYTIALSSVPASTAGFSVPGLLVDAPEVPIDKRYRIVTRSDYASILTTTTTAAAWAAILWGQNRSPAEAYICRWVSAASSPHFIMTDYNTVVADWTAVTVSGDFAITDGVSTEEFATGSMAAVTSMADVAAIIETEVQTSTTFAADLAAATVTIDALGRMVLTSSDTGAAATTYSIIAPTGGAGDDITVAGFLNIASRAFVVAGLDAEDPDDAMAAVLAMDDTPFAFHEIGSSIAQQQSLAVACAAYKKFLLLNVRDTDAKDASATTDIAYILSNATNNNAHGSYTEHVADYPNAAINGEILTLPEGTGQLSLNAILQTNMSGLGADGTTVEALDATARAALDDKSCDYLIKPVTSVHLRHGLTFGGIEVRHRIGYYWAEARSTEEIYAYMLLNKVTTFSDKHIQAIGAILAKYLDILVTRECSESYTLNLPSAADISLVEKATHTLTLQEVASIISQYAINDAVITATATA